MPGLSFTMGGNVGGAVAGIKEVSLNLKDQRAILKNLQKEYAALSTQQARSSVGKSIAADIAIANAEIKRLGAASTSSFGVIGKGATKALSGLRSMAYILPGIGIAGIFNVAFDALGKLFDGMDSAPSHLKNFADSFAGAKSKFVEASGAVILLTSEIDLAKKGFISKDGVVKHYNETIGKTTGIVKSLNEAEEGLIKNGGAYIEMTLQKAVAEVAAGKAAERLFELAELRNKVLSDNGKIDFFDKNLPALGTNLINKQASRIKNQINDLKSIMQEAMRAASLFHFNFFQDTKAPPTPKPDNFRSDVHVKLALHPEFTINEKEIRNALLHLDGNKPFKEIVEESINRDIEKLVVEPHFKVNENLKGISEEMQKLAAIGEMVGNTLADAFGKVFDAVAEGGNVFKALGEAVKSLVLDLIKAAIQSAIVAAIMNIIVPGSGSTAKGAGIFRNLLHFEKGGRPPVGRPSIVGENGPELFIPGTSGQIIPNHNLGSISGAAAQLIHVTVSGAISGRDLVLIKAREDRYQGRNV